MSSYGFVIDQRKCIGCHACTVACKMENEVPLGSFRTWVKYVEKGEFPNTRRQFSVMRCNHCSDAPCVTICPTSALYTRHDGIVDVDNRRCIGCKSCMAACPYDAIYLDPDDHTAAKCHYCAHRVGIGLQPACVLVCPVQAIVSGDLDDPESAISRLVAREPVRVRKPEQGTNPKLFYIGADEASLVPEIAHQPAAYIWAELHPEEQEHFALNPAGLDTSTEPHVVYNVAHEKPWRRMVSGYLWTKSIAAGVAMVAGALLGLGKFTADASLTRIAPLLALLFLGVTGVLLVADLGKPSRFLYILTKPNFRSWLVWGSYVLMVFGLAALAWLLGATWVAWPVAVLGAMTAAYSGFLFGQAEARDFWQSPLVPVHLLIQAVTAGAAALLSPANWLSPGLVPLLATVLASGLIGHALFLAAELAMPHASLMVAQTSSLITRGPYARRFWSLAVGLGVLLPLMTLASGIAVPLGGLAALLGLLVYEDIWVQAGQAVPLS